MDRGSRAPVHLSGSSHANPSIYMHKVLEKMVNHRSPTPVSFTKFCHIMQHDHLQEKCSDRLTLNPGIEGVCKDIVCLALCCTLYCCTDLMCNMTTFRKKGFTF